MLQRAAQQAERLELRREHRLHPLLARRIRHENRVEHHQPPLPQ
jgi:hypothetical protein